jgi:hypothetical protein
MFEDAVIGHILPVRPRFRKRLPARFLNQFACDTRVNGKPYSGSGGKEMLHLLGPQDTAESDAWRKPWDDVAAVLAKAGDAK